MRQLSERLLTRSLGGTVRLQAGDLFARQRILFRFELLVRMLDEALLFPAVAETTHRALEVVSRQWQGVKAMPLYPAFRRSS